MRSLSAEILTALAARKLVARDFVWFIARTRDAEPVEVVEGLWSDIGKTSLEVIDPLTGSAQEREFYGSGGLVKISDIPSVANLTVQTVTITISHLDARAQNLVRTYDCKQAVVQVFRGMYDPRTRALVSPAAPRFLGFVDKINIKTPPEGEFGSAELTCLSATQELTRSNSDTRSHESQTRRAVSLGHTADDFYKDVGTVGKWEFWWGQEKGGPPHRSPYKGEEPVK